MKSHDNPRNPTGRRQFWTRIGIAFAAIAFAWIGVVLVDPLSNEERRLLGTWHHTATLPSMDDFTITFHKHRGVTMFQSTGVARPAQWRVRGGQLELMEYSDRAVRRTFLQTIRWKWNVLLARILQGVNISDATEVYRLRFLTKDHIEWIHVPTRDFPSVEYVLPLQRMAGASGNVENDR